jgi:hypothetical protein
VTTLREGRTALAAALETAGVTVSPALGRIAPPCAVIFGNGIDPTHLLRGQAEAGYRVMLEAGRADQEVSALELGDMVLAAIAAIRSLAGWRLGTIGVDTIRVIGAAEILTADVVGHSFVTV